MSIDVISVLTRLIEKIDKKAIKKRVQQLRSSFPALSNEQLCNLIIGKDAVACGLVGAGTGALPGPFNWAALIPDITNLLLKQSAIVLCIAYIYGHDPSSQERLVEILACLGITSGAVAGNEQVKRLVKLGLQSKLAKEIAKKISVIISKRLIGRIVPIVGAIVGGSLNYAGVVSVGKTAVKYYSNKNCNNTAPIL